MLMSDQEHEWAKKYGFQITDDQFGHFILIDPELPAKKNKFKGGNLHSLMIQAINERKETHSAKKETKGRVIPFVPKAPKTPPKKTVRHGKMFEMRKMVYENNNITPQEMLDKLKDMGMASSLTVAITVKNDFLASLKVLLELGVVLVD